MTTLNLARAVLDAARIREDSYDKVSADAATAKQEAEEAQHNKDRPGELFYRVVDYSSFYTKTLRDASIEACSLHDMDGAGELVYLALDGWWNDSLDWAKQCTEVGHVRPR